ncbi:glycosyltransferase involved in cell wall biosynthesis [Bradyrhizobium sp. S3.12.5]|uniref:glycosyltransferase family 2 protein n=1 Tax=Bradyrhizobium sp. S3.12.5 TaxID=3156386 RepID=UPI00339257B6
MKTISVVTPCYNEEASIIECVDTVQEIFRRHLPNYGLEHIFCDNCSIDRTVEILKTIADQNPSVKIIVNSRDFGILKNTYNGVLAANGDAIVLFLPVDLQDPPDLIPEMVRLWEHGSEIVYGVRARREENFLVRLTRKAYYRVLSRVTYVNYPPDAGDFQLVDRRVLEAMKRIEDAQPFMRMMTFDCGFRSVGIKYTWRARKHGKSRNRFSHMLEQGLNGIISFSGIPVRLALFAGMLIAAASVLYAVLVILLTLTGNIRSFPGVPTIIAALFFFGGMQLLFLGLIGEYILAIFNQVRRRPLVIERERINFK